MSVWDPAHAPKNFSRSVPHGKPPRLNIQRKAALSMQHAVLALEMGSQSLLMGGNLFLHSFSIRVMDPVKTISSGFFLSPIFFHLHSPTWPSNEERSERHWPKTFQSQRPSLEPRAARSVALFAFLQGFPRLFCCANWGGLSRATATWKNRSASLSKSLAPKIQRCKQWSSLCDFAVTMMIGSFGSGIVTAQRFSGASQAADVRHLDVQQDQIHGRSRWTRFSNSFRVGPPVRPDVNPLRVNLRASMSRFISLSSTMSKPAWPRILSSFFFTVSKFSIFSLRRPNSTGLVS